MSALRAVLAIPGVVAGLWAFGLAVSAASGQVVARVVRAAMGGFSVVDDGHLLANIALFFGQHPAAGAALVWSVVGAAAVAATASMLTLPGILARLRNEGGFFESVGRHLPAIAAVHGQHLVLRVVVLFAVVISTTALPPVVKWSVFAVAYVYCTCALDAACIHVMRDGASWKHPRTVAMAFLSLSKTPRVLAAGLFLGLLKWAVVGATVFVSLRGMDDGSGVWGARLLVLVALLLSLWRISILAFGVLPARRAQAARAQAAAAA